MRTAVFNTKYFNLVKEFSLAGFKAKDQHSALGFLWSFINPLVMSGIMFVLFKNKMAAGFGREYFLYVLIGTVTWNFFAVTTTAGLTALLVRPDMIKNITFPRETLVYGWMGTFLIQYMFELLAVFVFMVLFGVHISIHILLLPLIIIMELAFITGVSLFLSCVNVYATDLQHLWGALTRIAFFMVPIFYGINSISPRLQWIIVINPMSQIMMFSRDVLIYHKFPPVDRLALVFLVSLCVLALGHCFFKYYEHRVAERV